MVKKAFLVKVTPPKLPKMHFWWKLLPQNRPKFQKAQFRVPSQIFCKSASNNFCSFFSGMMVLLVQHRNNTAVEEANFDFNDSADKQLEYKTFWERLRDSMMNAFGNQSDDISHVSSISSRSVQHPVTGIHYGSISWYLWMHSVKKREIYSHLKKYFVKTQLLWICSESNAITSWRKIKLPLQHTLWNLQDFSVTFTFLREIDVKCEWQKNSEISALYYCTAKNYN